MRLTLWTDYARRALIYVAAKTEALSTIAEIAETFGVSRSHPMKILNRLAQAGLPRYGPRPSRGHPARTAGIGDRCRRRGARH